MVSDFSILLESLTTNEVDQWWHTQNEESVPSGQQEWKYRFEKFGKSFPIKYVISELAKLKDIDLSTRSFGSDNNVRDRFAKKFDVEITEKLVFDRTEQKDFLEAFNQIADKKLFYDWLSFVNGVLNELEVPPYYTRFALKTDGKLFGVEIGNCFVWEYHYGDTGLIRLGFMLNRDFAKENERRFETKFEFKSVDNLVNVIVKVKEWNDLPLDLLGNHKAAATEYIRRNAKTGKLNNRRDSSTSNSFLKMLAYKNIKVEEALEVAPDINRSATSSEKKRDKKTTESMKPKNTILYGPPGTGKTYNSIDLSVQICSPVRYVEGDHKSNKKVYDELVAAGQIQMVTFHQSMTYEDFVEGIKPQEPKSEGDTITYATVPGIFREICTEATKSEEDKSFDDAYDDFVNWLNEEGEFILETPSQKKPFNLRVNSMRNFVATPQTGVGTQMVVTKEFIKEYIYNDEIRDWKPYLIPIVEYFKKYFFKSSGAANLVDNRKKDFVLIIDEINRGNIAAIFGELITLIEPDKRINEANELSIILPYSKKKFGVPSNLHILGTMNTADRSVEALDTALRRRFSFIEMPPQYYLKELQVVISGVKLSDILRTINSRIEKLLDKDHLIGHAYFIGVQDASQLARVFNDRIVPLLQEYFYNDYAKIGMVVGRGFVTSKSDTVGFADFDDGIDSDYENKGVYSIKLVDETSIQEAIEHLMNKKADVS